MTRRLLLAGLLLALAVASVAVAPSSTAEILPPPPELPVPPADGNPLADILGPASATACDAIATVYGLAGPIASAQLPPDLQVLLTEVDPYLALVTYACGLLVVPPSGVVCAVDEQINAQTGVLGAPVGVPPTFSIFYDTAAGIERAFLRAGVDIGQDASEALATALGCGIPEPVEVGVPAALPVVPAVPTVEVAAPLTPGFSLPRVPAVVGRTTPGQTTSLPGTAGLLGTLRYPVRSTAALLLALPLVLMAVGVVLAPRIGPRRRRPLRPTEAGS